MSFGARLLHSLVFSSVQWVADIWQNPPPRVGAKIINKSGAGQESGRLRPSGKYREKSPRAHSVFKKLAYFTHTAGFLN